MDQDAIQFHYRPGYGFLATCLELSGTGLSYEVVPAGQLCL